MSALWLLFSQVALADSFQVSCWRGCEAGGDDTPELLVRSAAETPLTLEWRTRTNPADQGVTVRLYAGNPAKAASLTDYGPLELVPDGSRFAARVEFPARDVGEDSFITVLVAEKGRSQEILDWRAFRVLTPEEAALQAAAPPPASGWELDIRPQAIRADTPRGPLPHSAGGAQAWWSIADQEVWTNLDLDGESSGVPGLGAQVAQPWPAGADTDWKQSVLDRVGGVDGHSVRFEELRWVEKPDAVVVQPGSAGGEVRLAHYYTTVTIYTNAQALPMSARDSGGARDRAWYAHETSADLNNPDDPRYWASYNLRDLGADPKLLELLASQLKSGRGVPGLPTQVMNDGDGGAPEFQVGFVVQLDRWVPPADLPKAGVQAGVVAIDVVASRAGIGTPTTAGSASQSELANLLNGLMNQAPKERPLDLDNPPEGSFIAPAVAALGSRTGSVPLLTGPARLAQRGVGGLLNPFAAVSEPSGPRKVFPGAARFALAATLRAGALMQEGALGNRQHPRGLLPVNAYAQWVLKITVGMDASDQLITSDEALIASSEEMATQTNVVEKPPGVADRVSSALGVPKWAMGLVAAVGGLIALALFFPGFGQAVGAVLKGLTRVASKVGRATEKLEKPRGNTVSAGLAEATVALATDPAAPPVSAEGLRVVVTVESGGVVVARTVVEVGKG